MIRLLAERVSVEKTRLEGSSSKPSSEIVMPDFTPLLDSQTRGHDRVGSRNSFKHNAAVASVARIAFRLMTRRLERVIFTATTGRSGTKTLAKIFAGVADCVSRHEPYPIMNGAVLKAVTNGNMASADSVYWRVKSINIRRAAVGYRYYFEGNHSFIKTFFQHAIADFGDRLAVVHLVRPPLEVAMSIYRLQDYPGTEVGNSWWLDYHAPTNLIQIADILDREPEFSHSFYKALWYWHEIEMRIATLRAAMPSLRIARFETQWSNDYARVRALLAELGLECGNLANEPLIGVRENTRTEQKQIAALPDAEAQDMYSRFRGLLFGLDIDTSMIGNTRPHLQGAGATASAQHMGPQGIATA